MKRRKRLQRNRVSDWGITVFTAFFFMVVGCGGGTPPSPPPAKTKSSPVAKKKEEPAKVAEVNVPAKNEEKEFTYDPVGKPDPFKPFIQLTPIRESSRGTPLTPLQKYDISQLKLVAIIIAPEGNIALVEDAAGKGYFLKRGVWIGKNDGKVTKILKDKVIVEEVFQDAFGQTKVHEISLILHQVEEGGES